MDNNRGTPGTSGRSRTRSSGSDQFQDTDELSGFVRQFFNNYTAGQSAGEDASYPYYRCTMAALRNLKNALEVVAEFTEELQDEISLLTDRFQLKEDLLSAVDRARIGGDAESVVPRGYLARDVSRYEASGLLQPSGSEDEGKTMSPNNISLHSSMADVPTRGFMDEIAPYKPSASLFGSSTSRSWSPIASFVTPEELEEHFRREDKLRERQLAWIMRDYEKIKVQIEPGAFSTESSDTGSSDSSQDFSFSRRRRRRCRQEKKAEVSLPVAPRTVVEPGTRPQRTVLISPAQLQDRGTTRRPTPAPQWKGDDFPPLQKSD